MQQIIPLMQLVSRVAAIGLPQKLLAQRAGVAASTVSRIFERGTCNSGTLEKLSTVVLEEEKRVAAHLGKLEGAE